ncbi:MAG: hypothetical protein ACN6IW_00360 [Paracoccaceae bacterium]
MEEKLSGRSVDAAAPSFADALSFIDGAPDISPTRRRDLASGLRRVAKAIGCEPSEIPADPAWLRPRIARVAPAAVGLTSKSWSNTVSDAKAALAAFGVIEGKQPKPTPLSASWEPLWRLVLASKDPSLSPALGRFVRFLSRLGVEPEEVADAHADAYERALALNEIRRSPDEPRRAAVYGWNLAVRRLPDWPRRTLSVASRSRTYALALEDFPPSFAADLDRCLEGMSAPDPFDPEARARPLRPATVRHRRDTLRRAASALVLAGEPIETITDLGVLADPAQVRRLLGWMLERNGGATSPGIAETAITLTLVARHHLRASEDQLAALKRLETRLAPRRSPGLTPKNRERLRPLGDATTLRKLLDLPRVLAAKARTNPKPYFAALDMEMAVAIAILLVVPIRRKNLAEIQLERNLVRMRDGRAFLVFDAAEVKNRRPLEFELRPEVVELIDLYLREYRPRLAPAGTRFLFARRADGGPCEKSALSRRVSAVIRRETGLAFNLHLFRHLAAMIWLDANPGSYEPLRRLLGHAQLSAVLDAYVGFEAGVTTRLFSELVETLRGVRR